MKNFYLLILLFLSLDAFGVCSSPISRTNSSANTVLTSTKYNTDLNTAYTKINEFDGDCITDNTIPTAKYKASSVTKAKLATDARDTTIISKTASYTALNTDEYISVDSTIGATTITLPTAVGISGRKLSIVKTDATVNLVTIDGNASETINGALTKPLGTQFDAITIVSNGSNWIIFDRTTPSPWVTCGLVAADFTGFGTPTLIDMQCKRDKEDLLIRGRFMSGTTTGVEGRVALKFGGVTYTSAPIAKIPNLQKAGTYIFSVNAAYYQAILIEPAVSYFTFGLQSAGSAAMTKATGTAVSSLGALVSIEARIPIVGWED